MLKLVTDRRLAEADHRVLHGMCHWTRLAKYGALPVCIALWVIVAILNCILPAADADVNTVKEDDVCKVCMDAIVNCILLECGHMVSCTDCGKRLAECPICRRYVSRVVHVFRVWAGPTYSLANCVNISTISRPDCIQMWFHSIIIIIIMLYYNVEKHNNWRAVLTGNGNRSPVNSGRQLG